MKSPKTMPERAKQQLGKVHKFYMDKFKFYNTWHNQPNSSKIHKITLALFALFALISALYVMPFSPFRVRASAKLEMYIPSPEVRLGFPVLVRNSFSNSARLVINLHKSGSSPILIYDGSPPNYSSAEGTESLVATVNMRGKEIGTYTISGALYDNFGNKIAEYSKTWTKTWVNYPKVGIDENNAILRNNVPIFPVEKYLGDRNSFGWPTSGMATGYIGKGYSNEGYVNGYTIPLWNAEMDEQLAAYGVNWTVSGPEFRIGNQLDETRLYVANPPSEPYSPFA